MTEPIISVRDLSVSYDGHRVFDHVNLDIEPNEVMVLLGGSGSGKSTLLRHIIGLERPSSGTILIRGVDINGCSAKALKDIRRTVGVAFQ
jgi:phospholipid/cholesterol/gamma-HCH transport system ATP-binding protein